MSAASAERTKCYTHDGLPAVLMGDVIEEANAASCPHCLTKVDDSISGIMTCVQHDGLIADGPVKFGLDEYLMAVISEPAITPMAATTDDLLETMAVTAEPAIMEEAVTSEPAIGMKRYSFKRSNVQTVFTYCWEQDPGVVDISFSPALTHCQAKYSDSRVSSLGGKE